MPVDHSIENFKIGTGLFSVAVALLAQFWPTPFPDNKYLLAICVSFYFLCQGLAYIHSYIVGQSTFLTTKVRVSRAAALWMTVR